MTAKLPEFFSRDELKQRQELRLRQLIGEVVPHNAFWAKRFAAAGLKPHDVWTLEDLAQLPLTAKQSLVDDQLASPPYGTNLTGPPGRFCRLHQTSGTTGHPLRWLDTAASWDWVVSCWEQILSHHGRDGGRRRRLPVLVRTLLGILGRL